MKCGLCESERVADNVCESCGAKLVNNVWKRICKRCNKETKELYDLFIPHNCKKCSDELHEQSRKEKDYCLMCGKLRMDCYC